LRKASEYISRGSKMRDLIDQMEKDLAEISQHLHHDIIPFWLERGMDEIYGGYLTCFDSQGERATDTDKYLVTQTRMIWGLSAFSQICPEKEKLLTEAKQGINFLINHFWDSKTGGWFWKVEQDGTLLDDGKVVYGQSFAIYALAQYYLVTGDSKVLDYAEKTFDLLQKYCADTLNGGYYENLEPNWVVASSGFHGGDRKSLDVHMISWRHLQH
jgi:mannose/cellobiose epimerase-like protein (N-acyl-D-glucosamine 2-epimerase family)